MGNNYCFGGLEQISSSDLRIEAYRLVKEEIYKTMCNIDGYSSAVLLDPKKANPNDTSAFELGIDNLFEKVIEKKSFFGLKSEQAREKRPFPIIFERKFIDGKCAFCEVVTQIEFEEYESPNGYGVNIIDPTKLSTLTLRGCHLLNDQAVATLFGLLNDDQKNEYIKNVKILKESIEKFSVLCEKMQNSEQKAVEYIKSIKV